MPTKAELIWRMLGAEGSAADGTWPRLLRPGSWRSLGTPVLGTITSLFTKISDEQVAAELETLDARRKRDLPAAEAPREPN